MAETPCPFSVGTRIRLICSLPGACNGAEGRVTRVICDNVGAVTALDVLIETPTPHGTTVYPHEVTVLSAASAPLSP